MTARSAGVSHLDGVPALDEVARHIASRRAGDARGDVVPRHARHGRPVHQVCGTGSAPVRAPTKEHTPPPLCRHTTAYHSPVNGESTAKSLTMKLA